MSTTNTSTGLLNEDQAAEILGITAGTLSVWRCTKRYNLKYIRVGRAIRYRRSDLEAFIESRAVSNVEISQ